MKTPIKSIFFVIICLAFITNIGFAGGQQEGSAAGPTKKTEIIFMTHTYKTFNDLLDETIEMYMADHPEVMEDMLLDILPVTIEPAKYKCGSLRRERNRFTNFLSGVAYCLEKANRS